MTKRLVRLAAVLAAAMLCAVPLWAAQQTKPLVYWGWEYTVECLKANMDEFARAHPEIKVVFKTLSPADIYVKLPSALSSGIGVPDVVAVEDSHLPAVISTGGVLDLTAQAAAYQPAFNAFKWANCAPGGRIYAIPWDSGPVAVFYRRDVFRQAGLPEEPDRVAKLLETWEDFCLAARTVKEKTGAAMLPLAANSNDGRFFEMLLQQQGLGYFDDKGRVAVEDPRSLRALELLGRLYKDGLTHDSQPWTPPWQEALRDGRTATVIGGAWMDSFLRGWIAPQTAGQWGVAPLPGWTKGNGTRTSNDGGSALIIPKRAKQTEAAWTFVQFMMARKESQLNMMKKFDSFPALTAAYSDPYFAEPVPFYANQPVRKLFAELVRQVRPWPYTEYYALANNACSAEIQAYLSGAKSAKAALASAAAAIRARMGK